MLRNIRLAIKDFSRSRVSLYVAKKHFSSSKLGIFQTIEFELRRRCNGACPFCAASIQNEKRTDISMDEEIFYKVIKELGEIEYEGRINFFVNTEPLLDKRLPEFVSYAREICPKAYLLVITNGKSLSNAKGELLIRNGLDLLEINNYSDDAGLARNVARFMEDVAPRYPNKVRLNRRQLTVQLNNRSGSSPNGRQLTKPLKAFCQKPFNYIIVSAEGKVGFCENDFYFEEVVGEVYKDNIVDIWNSDRYRTIRESLLSGDRTVTTACSKCDYSGFKRISNPNAPYHGARRAPNITVLDGILDNVIAITNKF